MLNKFPKLDVYGSQFSHNAFTSEYSRRHQTRHSNFADKIILIFLISIWVKHEITDLCDTFYPLIDNKC